MKFEEWFNDEYGDEIDFRILHMLKEDTRKAWDYQQKKINKLENIYTEINDLLENHREGYLSPLSTIDEIDRLMKEIE